MLAATPQDSEGLVLRGKSLLNEKEYDQGIRDLKKAIEADPKNVRIYIELGLAYAVPDDDVATQSGCISGRTDDDERPPRVLDDL